MGTTGTLLVKACSFGVNFGCIVAFINIISDVLSSVAGSVIPPGAEPTRQAIMTALVLGGMIPLSVFLNSSAALGHVSLTSVGLIHWCAHPSEYRCPSVFVISTAILGHVYWQGHTCDYLFIGTATPAGVLVAFAFVSLFQGHLEVTLWNMEGLAVSFPIIAFAFASQTILFQVASTMRTTSLPKIFTVVDRSMYALCSAGLHCVSVSDLQCTA